MVARATRGERLCGVLANTHARLDHVDDEVAQALTLLDDIHIHGAHGVGVLVVVDVGDVLVAELVAVVVDLVLHIERAVGVELVAVALEHDRHLRQGVVGKLEHLVDVLILRLGESLLAVLQPADGACEIVVAVADALDLGDLAKHGAHLLLRLVGEVGVRHVVEILGDLHLHIVGDALILLDARVELHKLVVVLLTQQLAHHAKHAVDTLGKALDLLLGLKHRELGRLHDTRRDETQTEIVLVLVGLGFPYPAAHARHLLHEGQEQDGVADVETGVEGSQREGELCGGMRERGVGGVETHESARHVDEVAEHCEHPDDAHHIEEQVAEGGAARLGVGRERHEVGRERGADVLAHNQRDAEVNGQVGLRAEHHGDGHERRGALQDARQDGAKEQEQQDGGEAIGVEAGEEGLQGAHLLGWHLRLAEGGQGQEHKGYTKEEIAYVTAFLRIDKQQSDEENWPHEIAYLKREAGRHDPGRERGADVGAHDDRDGLDKGEQSGVDERDGHHGGGGRRLYGDGCKHTREHSRYAVGGHGAKHMAKLGSCQLLQSLAHYLHTIDKKGQGSNDF